MADKYCSAKFKNGEELDAALEKALIVDKCCARAEAAAETATAATKEMHGIAVLNVKQELSDEQRAQVLENIGLEPYNRLKDATWVNGYRYDGGNMADENTAAWYGYQMTSSKVSVTPGTVLRFEAAIPAKRGASYGNTPGSETAMGVHVYEYDSSGNWKKRYINDGLTGTVSGDLEIFTLKHTVSDGAYFIEVAPRTFLADPNEAFVLYDANQADFESRLTPIATANDEGKALVVEGGKWVAKGIGSDAVKFTEQELTSQQKAQTRENIGALSMEDLESGAKDILEGQNWIRGYIAGGGSLVKIESEITWYGYTGVTEGVIPVEAGHTYYYEYKLPADVADRASTGSKTNLEVGFGEWDSSMKWIQRVLHQRDKGTLPESTIEGEYEVVRGEYIPSENTAFVQVTTHTYRTDCNGAEVLSISDRPKSSSKLLPEVSSSDNGKILRVVGGEWVAEDPDQDSYAVKFTEQELTGGQMAQARENIGALSEEDLKSKVPNILENQNWIRGYVAWNGTLETSESVDYYGYPAVTEDLIPIEAGRTCYYEYKVFADIGDRVSTGSKTDLEVGFGEYDASGKFIQRVLYQRGVGTLPESTIDGEYEVVKGEHTLSENTAFVRVTAHTYRTDHNGAEVLSMADRLEGNSKLLPEVSSADNGKILRVVGGQWEASEQDIKPTGHHYTGEKMPSEVHYFDSERIFTMSGTNLTSQDTEVYGNYYFVACSNTEQIRVYSLEDNSWLADMLIGVNHGSGMQFSNEFYESTDEFPLVYVGGDTTGKINVIRITNTNGTWSASVVRTLYIPPAYGYWLAPSIDAKNNILYTYGYKLSGYWTVVGNAMKLARWDLGNLTENDDGTYTPVIISECESPYLGVTQGRKFYGGNLYVAFANTSNPHNAKIVTIDAVTGAVKSDIDMTVVTTSEAEGLCYRIVDTRVYWYLNDYWNVYKLTF